MFIRNTYLVSRLANSYVTFLTLQKIFHTTRGDHGAVYCRRGGGESVIRQFLAHNDGILSSCSSIASSKTSQSVILYFFFYSSLFPAQNSLSKMRSRLSPLEWHKVTEWRCKLELNTEYSAIKKQLTEAHGGSDLLNDSRFKILMKC